MKKVGKFLSVLLLHAPKDVYARKIKKILYIDIPLQYCNLKNFDYW